MGNSNRQITIKAKILHDDVKGSRWKIWYAAQYKQAWVAKDEVEFEPGMNLRRGSFTMLESYAYEKDLM